MHTWKKFTNIRAELISSLSETGMDDSEIANTLSINERQVVLAKGGHRKISGISSAAVSYRDMIFTLPRPNRHYHIMHNMTLELGIPLNGRTQGFITSNGEFVNRKEAAKIAIESGQAEKMEFVHDELFSEDLW